MTNLLLASNNLFNGAFVFVLGILVIFFGIEVIVLVISGIGKIMSAKNKKSTVVEDEDEDDDDIAVVSDASQTYEGASPEVVAAITAVLSAYYFSNESNCEFKIKKIKRIN